MVVNLILCDFPHTLLADSLDDNGRLTASLRSDRGKGRRGSCVEQTRLGCVRPHRSEDLRHPLLVHRIQNCIPPEPSSRGVHHELAVTQSRDNRVGSATARAANLATRSEWLEAGARDASLELPLRDVRINPGANLEEKCPQPFSVRNRSRKPLGNNISENLRGDEP